MQRNEPAEAWDQLLRTYDTLICAQGSKGEKKLFAKTTTLKERERERERQGDREQKNVAGRAAKKSNLSLQRLTLLRSFL
jgi:hypothetical protein